MAQPKWFAVAALGLEQVVLNELLALAPALELVALTGGIEFAASADEARGLLPGLRVCTRLWRRLAQTRARSFGELERKWAALAWSQFVRPGQLVRVEVTVHQCRLYHTKALQQRLVEAVGHSLGSPVKLAAPSADDAEDASSADGVDEPLRILVRGQSDVFSVSVDASGDRLHRRGYRIEIGKAPLRETLAAGLLKLCDWNPAEALVDPMCGSGTLPIEAALMATGRAVPRQTFAMDNWPQRQGLPLPGPSHVVAPTLPPRIWAFDKDSNMVDRARRNAERAGVDNDITWCAQAFEQATPPVEAGLLLFNPPYGHRLAAGRVQAGAWRALVATLARWRGWRAAVLVPKGAQLEAGNVRVQARHALRNGGLAVELVQLSL